jgi:hypothetical protein
MTTPLATIFHGDVTLEVGSDTGLFGFGDLNVNRRGVFNGTTASTNPSSGNIVNFGGFGNVGAVFLDNTFDVNGASTLDQVTIDTTDGQTLINGPNAVNISVGAASNFTSTGGNVTLSSVSQNAIVQGGNAGSDAVQLTATNAAGGVQILSGTSSGIVNVATGSGGFNVGASAGSVNTTSYGASSNFVVQSTSAGQDLNITLNGNNDSSINILSSGSGSDAININSTNTAGNILVQNASGLGGGGITVRSGTSGITALTNTGGAISFTSQAANSTYTVNSATSGQNLILSTTGFHNSGVIIQSEGINNSSGSIQIKNLNTSGSIVISQPNNGTGKVEIQAGSGGILGYTTSGNINLTSFQNSSTYKTITNASGQNLNILLEGTTASQILIQSQGTGNDAIRLQTTSASGGIYAFANGRIDIQTTDTTNGINIGTINSGVVNIGKTGTTTTIFGSLDVQGPVTTVQSQTLTVEDNVIFVNNGPTATSDGGFAVKRWQSANDAGTGTVVNPPANPPGYETATAQAGNATTITLAVAANASNDFYNGWWLRITSGTGSGQVRRIKAYNGTTKVASIYTTADQTGVLGNPTPTEGLDFSTSPDNTSVYALYPTAFVMNIWDESEEEFAFVYANLDSEQQITFNGNYADLHIRNLTADSITANTINNTTTDLVFNVTLTDNSTTPVVMTGLTLTYGIYMVFVRPETAVTNRPSAIFLIGRLNSAGDSGQSVRLISVKAAGNSQLDIQWASGGVKPSLYYRNDPNVAGTTVYTLRCLTI